MLHIVKGLGQRAGALARAGLVGTVAATIFAGSVFAGGPEPLPELQARELAAEVMREAGDGSLGAWTRGVIERALERAGEAATEAAADLAAGNGADGSPVPLPAERHAARTAAGIGGRPNSAEILVFMSLAVPPASWREWAREAALFDAPLVLRGVGGGGLRETVKAVGERLGGHEAGVAIDPRLFRLFDIQLVPAVVAVPGGVPGRSPVPACESRGCADDPAPAHDLVAGNIGLMAALEAIAAEGDAGRRVARIMLDRLSGENR